MSFNLYQLLLKILLSLSIYKDKSFFEINFRANILFRHPIAKPLNVILYQ
jgi:hypothetical protein